MTSDIDPIFLMLIHAYPDISGYRQNSSDRVFEEIFNEGRQFRRDLAKELESLCALHPEGSAATQADRTKILRGAATALHSAGFQNMGATSLKPKHVQLLLDTWQSQGLAISTIKNRMAAIRWWANKVAKQDCIPTTNSAAGIGARPYVRGSKLLRTLTAKDLEKINSQRMRLCLELQQAFGLRVLESIRFQPSAGINFKEGYVELKRSWGYEYTPRKIPITTGYQRKVLSAALEIAPTGSMISQGKNYKYWQRAFNRLTRPIEKEKLNRLRHGYAQSRFESLTGFKSPLQGGPVWESMSESQRNADKLARTQICEEMGWQYIEKTFIYLDSADSRNNKRLMEAITELPPLFASVAVPRVGNPEVPKCELVMEPHGQRNAELLPPVVQEPSELVMEPHGQRNAELLPPVVQEPSELVMEFMGWLRDGLGQRQIKFNEAGAMVHFVEEGMALVSPRIFREFSKVSVVVAAEEIDITRRVQRELIKCGWHLKAPNNSNFVRYQIHIKGSIVGVLGSVVLTQPDRFVDVVPSVNPALKMA